MTGGTAYQKKIKPRLWSSQVIQKTSKRICFSKEKLQYTVPGQKNWKTQLRKKKKKGTGLVCWKRKIDTPAGGWGLWADEAAAIKQLALCKSEKEKRAALKVQLTFQQKVLGCNCEKTLFYLSSKRNIVFYWVTQ